MFFRLPPFFFACAPINGGSITACSDKHVQSRFLASQKLVCAFLGLADLAHCGSAGRTWTRGGGPAPAPIATSTISCAGTGKTRTSSTASSSAPAPKRHKRGSVPLDLPPDSSPQQVLSTVSVSMMLNRSSAPPILSCSLHVVCSLSYMIHGPLTWLKHSKSPS